MKIAINDIPDSGSLEIKHQFAPDELNLGGNEVSPCGPVEVSLKTAKVINNVNVEALISGTLHFNCSRCLKTYKWPLKKKSNFNYEIESKDLFIDIDQDLRDEIILDFSIKSLCRTDCKGLCVSCGKNLNEGKCKCVS